MSAKAVKTDLAPIYVLYAHYTCCDLEELKLDLLRNRNPVFYRELTDFSLDQEHDKLLLLFDAYLSLKLNPELPIIELGTPPI